MCIRAFSRILRTWKHCKHWSVTVRRTAPLRTLVATRLPLRISPAAAELPRGPAPLILIRPPGQWGLHGAWRWRENFREVGSPNSREVNPGPVVAFAGIEQAQQREIHEDQIIEPFRLRASKIEVL
eukprot:1130576-Pyramimonas_sp.AAC.1